MHTRPPHTGTDRFPQDAGPGPTVTPLALDTAGRGASARPLTTAPSASAIRRTAGVRAARTLLLAVGAWVALAGGLAAAAEWGDLTGRFVFEGEPPQPQKINVNKDAACFGNPELYDESLVVAPDGGIANVVVYVRTKNVPVHPDYEATADDKVLLDNKRGRFEPHIVLIRLSQTLVIHNSDPCGHNSNLQPIADVGINPLITQNGQAEHRFNRAQNIPVPVSCNIHPWMRGYVLPRPNPYMAVSAEDGTFRIEKLPAGTELEFQVWQEKAGYVTKGQLDGKPVDWNRGRFKMTLKPGNNDLGTIKLPAEIFEK